MKKGYRFTFCLAVAVLLVSVFTAHAQQPDKISLGLAVAKTFEFYPAYLGVDLGVWKKRNLDVTVSTFRGDAAMQQAILAGSVQIGLSSGAASAGFIAKGQPIKVVASIGSKPNLMVLIVRPDAGIRRWEDLRGKTIGFTTHGALTDWLVRTMSAHMGWGVGGIKGIPLGGFTEQVAAMKRKQSDGFVWSYEGGMELEEKGEGKVLLSFGEII
ncbi:MAG: ABC transporter substrate-binding protein [Deltaproteobacteria bacterium]|nr:ABC transporter substrate-binding protein [Deltaproteobacteria bacterium]